MFDVGDLPVLDNCVLKSDLSDYRPKWPLKLYLLFYVFFEIHKHDFLRFL